MKEGGYILEFRHAETEYNRLKKWCGSIDASLNEDGERQSECAASIINRVIKESKLNIRRIYCGPKLRQIQTAYFFQKELKVPIITINAFREIDHGLCEGLTYEEIENKFPKLWQQFMKDKSKVVFPKGESIEDAWRRSGAGNAEMFQIEKRMTGDDDSDFLKISSGGILKLSIIDLMKCRLSVINNLKTPANTSVSILNFAQGWYSLAAYNWSPHLEILRGFDIRKLF